MAPLLLNRHLALWLPYVATEASDTALKVQLMPRSKCAALLWQLHLRSLPVWAAPMSSVCGWLGSRFI